MSWLHVSLVQMRCEKGAIQENLAAMAGYLRAGAERGVDIVCFPEMCITGYIEPRQRPEAVVRLDGPEVSRFLALSAGADLTAIAGFVEENPEGKPFITQIAAHRGTLLAVYRKRTIVAEEAEWFAPGAAPAVFAHHRACCGLAVCADIDAPTVFADVANLGATIVFEAAAPGLYGAQVTRDWRSGFAWWRGECTTKLGRYAREYGLFIAVATQAGRTIDEDFPGGGYLLGPKGQLLAASEDWSEGALYVDVPLG
jgi:predicted amidohydrolase